MNVNSSRLRKRIRDSILILFLVVLVVAFAIGSSGFLRPSNIVSILSNFSVLLILSLGISWVVMAGSLDISQAGIAGLVGILIGLILPVIGYGAIAVGILVGAGFGSLNGLIFTKARIPSFLVTLGTLFVTTGLEKYLAVTAHVLTNGIPIEGRLDVFLPTIPLLNVPRSFSLFYWAAGESILFYMISQKTRFGLRIYAIGSSASSTLLYGINVTGYQVLVFALSGAISAVAGFLYLPYLNIASPTFTDSLTFVTLAAVVLGGTALAGGVGGFHRTVIGALILSIINNGLTVMGLDALALFVVQGVIIIIAAVAVSRGIKTGIIQ